MTRDAPKAIRLGLIGVGRWGRNYIRTISCLEGGRLAAVASRNPHTAALVPAGCRIVNDWQTIVSADDIDGVIVATPPHAHARIVIAALEVSKPVLVEKPVVQSHADSLLIRPALDRRPAIVQVDHTHLFHPAFRALQKEARALGPVRSIDSAAGNHGPYRRDVSVLWDWAPHDLAMCLTLVPGHAVPVRAVRLDAQKVDGAIGERIALELQLAGGVEARIRISTMDERHRWFAAAFDSCTLVYRDTGEDQLVRFPPGADIQRGGGTAINVSNELPLTRAVIEFLRAIRTKNVDRTSIDLGLAVVDLIAEFETQFETPRSDRSSTFRT